LVAGGPLPHALGVADNVHVVGGSGEPVGDPAQHLGGTDPAADPLPVVGHRHGSGPGGEGLGLDVELHTRPALGELDQRLDVGVLSRAVVTHLPAPALRPAQPEAVQPTHTVLLLSVSATTSPRNSPVIRCCRLYKDTVKVPVSIGPPGDLLDTFGGRSGGWEHRMTLWTWAEETADKTRADGHEQLAVALVRLPELAALGDADRIAAELPAALRAAA